MDEKEGATLMPYKDPAKQKAWRDAHTAEAAAYFRAYRIENRERLAAAAKRQYAANRTAVRAAQAVYRAANRQRLIGNQRARYAANPGPARKQSKLYAAAHPECMRAWRKAWKKRNPESVSRYNRKRKAAMRGAPVCDLTRAQWEAIKVAFGHRCAYCGCRPDRLTQDHVIPVSKGGSHTASNIVPACARCNSSKGARVR